MIRVRQWAVATSMVVAGLVSACGGAPVAEETPAQVADQLNVIIYTVDTLRRDVLGVYGDTGRLTPHLDAFARDSWIFDDAIAQSSWTRASIASLMTGLEPDLHGVNDRDDALASSAVTLAELLSEAGYETAGVITNGNVSETFGFAQGFDNYSSPSRRRADADLNRRMFRRLGWASRNEPFFIYAHAIGPHAPYDAFDASREAQFGSAELELGQIDVLRAIRGKKRVVGDADRATIENLYREETAFHDAVFGAFVAQLKELGIYESTLVVVLSDHGEEFFEHDSWGHGHSLYAEVLDVPLLIKLPKLASGAFSTGRSSKLVQHTDIFATVMDLALGSSGPGTGASLRSLMMQSPQRWPERTLFAHLDLDHRSGSALLTEDWHFVEPSSPNFGESAMLFDRQADPAQTVNLALQNPEVVERFRALLERRATLPKPSGSESVEMPPELRQRLKALGYLN